MTKTTRKATFNVFLAVLALYVGAMVWNIAAPSPASAVVAGLTLVALAVVPLLTTFHKKH